MLVEHTLKFPLFTMVVTRFLVAACPQHVFTSFVIRRGCYSKVHRDIQNGPTGAAVIALSEVHEHEGLWIQDRTGTTFKEHNGVLIAGTVLPLSTPVVFDSRKLLHAGHTTVAAARTRVIVVAFSTLHASTMPWWVRDQLLDLGFRVPNNFQIRSATHSGIPPRLRQLSLKEALNLSVQDRDQHDVISVTDAE